MTLWSIKHSNEFVITIRVITVVQYIYNYKPKTNHVHRAQTVAAALYLQFMAKISPVTGLDWSRGFQEVKVPRFHDNGTGRW